ncbi:MAG: GAF domain-containing protein [Bacteroidales bacterium]|nr:GAF domain-containing protein [Bacteroidales bacterium]
MKKLPHPPKSWPLLALVLLIVSCISAYALAYNALHTAGGGAGLPIALLMLLAIGLGIALYIGHIKNYEAMEQLQHTSDQLRRQLEDIHSAKQQEQTAQKSSANKQHHDNTEQLIAQLLPKQDYSSNERLAEQLLSNIAHHFDIAQGTFHLYDPEANLFQLCAGYAYYTTGQPLSYPMGETLPGQVAKNQQTLRLDRLPEGYSCIKSGLGQSSPTSLLIVPVLDVQGSTIGIIELSSFKPLPSEHLFGELGKRFGQLITPPSAELWEPQQ